MKTDMEQFWYRTGTIGHTDEKSRLVLPTPSSKHGIEKLVLDATCFKPSNMEAARFLDGIDSDVLSPSPKGSAKPLPREPDRLSDEKCSKASDRLSKGRYSVLTPGKKSDSKSLIMGSDRPSDETCSVVTPPCQRSPSPEDSTELSITEFDRSTSRQCGVVKPLCQGSPGPYPTSEPLIMNSDRWAGEKGEIIVSPSPKNSAYAPSIHRHSKEYPEFSDSSSDSNTAKATEPTMPELAYLRPEALRSASTISLYSLQGDADQLNGFDRSLSWASVDRPQTADSEPRSPPPDKPDEVAVAALSGIMSPRSPRYSPIANDGVLEDIPLVEMKKDEPFVNFEAHLQHRKQRMRDAQAVFAMPGGDGSSDDSSDGGESDGSGEARTGFSYLDNGNGDLPSKPSFRRC
ncbi:hypothetical protein AC578_9033 [Pseudocercospora eumusae]|uniref:Uncharacterized protein n=1 Tax=Pseudocercospora eumusae TaxID=321146 RepID=A0A139H8I7_9PEZI|nr:hypothetical protein AC578_9033 [Pseudocercospora eumusae]